jgi:hypothetical protein
MLDQSPIGALGLLILVSADEPIKNLSDGEREIILVFIEHAPHLIEQRQRAGCAAEQYLNVKRFVW